MNQDVPNFNESRGREGRREGKNLTGQGVMGLQGTTEQGKVQYPVEGPILWKKGGSTLD